MVERPPVAIVPEPAVTPPLDAAIRDCLRAVFPVDDAIFSQSRHWHGSAPAYSLLAQADGVVVAHVGVVVRAVTAGGAAVTVAGIQNFAVRPAWRGTGLGAALMRGAMDEAQRRGIPYGLLFCVPALEPYYRALGWLALGAAARMDYDGRTDVPIPGKNISMAIALGAAPFPAGDIHLGGPDW